MRTCPPSGESESRCIELMAEGTSDASEVQLSPGQPTTFLFDSDVLADEMSLENRERFEVALGKRLITLVPSEKMHGEKPGKMMVCFADGAAPACATFRLVVHPAIAERQVDLFRHPRPVDSIQADLTKSYEENARLRAELGRLHAERNRPDGLTGLYTSGMMGEAGIPCSRLHVIQRKGETLNGWKLLACRAPGKMAVLVELTNPDGAAPWSAQGAKLVGPKGQELMGSVWPLGPILPTETRTLFIEVQATNVQTDGPFILKLWEAEGPRTVTLGGVTFPSLAEKPEP
ncbi:DUF2381 family protein [Archangium violaceum]|nr:DUF2381 family protein [Archangium violaceum]QRO02208.1 DUF2381 family protein [Archangium violaceum]